METQKQINTLFDACKYGALEDVVKFVEQDRVDVNAVDADTATALHWAALKGRLDMVEYLVAHKATVDVRTKNGQTAMHWAGIQGHVNCVHFLVKNGADIYAVDTCGYNLLHHACHKGHFMVAFYAVNHGIDINSKDGSGHTALHWACYDRHENVLMYLIKSGADVNVVDNAGVSAVHLCALKGFDKGLEAVLKAGADPMVLTQKGESPEQFAHRNNNTGVVLMLRKAQLVSFTPAAQKKLGNMWTMGVFFGALLLMFLFCYLPFWLFAILAYGAYYAFKNVATRYTPQSSTKTFVFVAWFLCVAIVSILFYFFKLRPALPGGTFWHFMFFLIACAVGYLYWQCLQGNPGLVQPNTFDIQTLEDILDRNEDIPEVCPTCMCVRPLRSKHCRHCDRCIARFDHHCVWVNNCIGVHNQKYFVAMLLALCVAHLHIIVCTFTMLHYNESIPTMFPIFPFLFNWISKEPLSFLMIIIHLIHVLWEANLATLQVFLLLNNLTTNESINWARYGFMTDPEGNFNNPFSNGVMNNVKEMLNGTKDWFGARLSDIRGMAGRSMYNPPAYPPPEAYAHQHDAIPPV